MDDNIPSMVRDSYVFPYVYLKKYFILFLIYTSVEGTRKKYVDPLDGHLRIPQWWPYVVGEKHDRHFKESTCNDSYLFPFSEVSIRKEGGVGGLVFNVVTHRTYESLWGVYWLRRCW